MVNYGAILKLAEEFEEAAETLRSGQIPYFDKPISVELVEPIDSWGEQEAAVMSVVYGLDKIADFAKKSSAFIEYSLKDPMSPVDFKKESESILKAINKLCDDVHEDLKNVY